MRTRKGERMMILDGKCSENNGRKVLEFSGWKLVKFDEFGDEKNKV